MMVNMPFKVLTKTDSKEIGLKLLGSVPSVFLGRGITLAVLNILGNTFFLKYSKQPKRERDRDRYRQTDRQTD